MEQLDDLRHRSLGKSLATARQGLAKANGRVLHLFVRICGAADKEEVLRMRQPLMAVLSVQADTEKADYLFFIFTVDCHREYSLDRRGSLSCFLDYTCRDQRRSIINCAANELAQAGRSLTVAAR